MRVRARKVWKAGTIVSKICRKSWKMKEVFSKKKVQREILRKCNIKEHREVGDSLEITKQEEADRRR